VNQKQAKLPKGAWTNVIAVVIGAVVIVIALVAAAVAIIANSNSNANTLHGRIDTLQTRIDTLQTRMDTLQTDMNAGFNETRRENNDRFGKLETKIDDVEKALAAHTAGHSHTTAQKPTSRNTAASAALSPEKNLPIIEAEATP